MTIPGELRAQKPGGFQAEGRFKKDPLPQAFHLAVEHLAIKVPAAVTDAVNDHGGHKTGAAAEQRAGPDDQAGLLLGVLAHVADQTAEHLAAAKCAVRRATRIDRS